MKPSVRDFSTNISGHQEPPIGVMVVDDSAVVRGLVTRWLEADPAIKVIASAPDGAAALKAQAIHAPDVIVLDVEMPNMDGMTALPKFLEQDPEVKVVMSSTLTARNAEISLKALESGAADYVAKPSSQTGLAAASEFRRELLEKVKVLASARRMRPRADAGRTTRLPQAQVVRQRPEGGLYGRAPITLRRAGTKQPRAILIGSSTGGPQALFTVLRHVAGKVSMPVLITQHMPATFTRILAEHIARQTGLDAHEARQGETLQNGVIYLAPGDYHLRLKQAPSACAPTVELDQSPAVNFCRPAVDPLFESAAQVFGGAVLAVVLTGMGHDGLAGAHNLTAAGGTVIAQDEASSVVWGMPGAVATGGLCSAVLPLDEIGPAIVRFAGGGRL